mmetsp:Transcript_28179/g.24902  ORF Transcript_28179/g.24902 Transcript_28179/m.24902 type:complete len:91 (+) Transcript_28179:29-301(+)
MKNATYNNEICLSLTNSNIKNELKNLSACKNSITLDNLSSIRQDLGPSLCNLKIPERNFDRPMTPSFNLSGGNCNPSLQKFLNINKNIET